MKNPKTKSDKKLNEEEAKQHHIWKQRKRKLDALRFEEMEEDMVEVPLPTPPGDS